MQFAQIYQEDLRTQLERFFNASFQRFFFYYRLEKTCSAEKITFKILNGKNAISFAYTLKIKTSKAGKVTLTVEELLLNEDQPLFSANPLLHDAGLLEILLYGIRTLIFLGNFFDVKQLSFRLPQEEADAIMYFNKIFTKIQDVYSKDNIITTFKMVLNTGLEHYFILRQENILQRIYQQLWSLQKSDPQIRQYFQNQQQKNECTV